MSEHIITPKKYEEICLKEYNKKGGVTCWNCKAFHKGKDLLVRCNKCGANY